MKSKTSPGKVSIIDLDKISSDGLQEGFIAFQLLEMGAPNSSMVKSYGRLKIFESYAGVLSIRKLRRGTVTFLVRARASRPNKGFPLKPSLICRFGPGTYRFELRGSQLRRLSIQPKLVLFGSNPPLYTSALRPNIFADPDMAKNQPIRILHS